jgi:hypothetical protein
MDRQEAMFVLQARRPNDRDAGQPAFDEALALVEGDPELKAWWDAQQAFDRTVAAKLEEVPVPADLRATILAGRKIEQLTPQPHLLSWLAAAAVVAILCVAGTLRQNDEYGPLAQADYAMTVLPLLNNDSPPLAMTSPDLGKIAAWLKSQDAPLGTLPAKMNGVPSVGCQKFAVHGHTVSLICFAMTDGHIAHLFIVDQKALTDPPAAGSAPEYNYVQGWSTASWSEGHMSYLLATQDGADALKQLL